MRSILDKPREKFRANLDAIAAREPEIRAFTAPGFDRDRAVAAFAAQMARADAPPLQGLTLGVKDVFALDGYPMRCGSTLPAERFDWPEASSVTALKRAGAVALGKTVTTEFASWAPGPTVNPHDRRRTPGGSSSGSAAGVAAGFFDLAFGSQTVGSTLRPAAYCGVIGFKPSLGRVPLDGMLTYAPALDHLGLITADLVLLAPVMAALDPSFRAAPPAASATLLVPDGAYLRQTAPAALASFETCLAALAEAGVAIARAPLLGDIAGLNQRIDRLAEAQASRAHSWLTAADRALLDPRTTAGLTLGASVGADEIAELIEEALALRAALTAALDTHGADGFAAPAAPDVAPLGLERTGDPCMNGVWTFVGLPAITLPAGSGEDGMPWGLQLIGRFGADGRLLASAAAIAEILARG